MIGCPKCGAQNVENARFCSQCGSPLITDMNQPALHGKPEQKVAGSHKVDCSVVRLMNDDIKVPYFDLDEVHEDWYDNYHYCLEGSAQ